MYKVNTKLGLEPLTKKVWASNRAIIYLPNTLAEARECFKHRVHQYPSPASSAYLRILGNAILQRCTTRKQLLRRADEEVPPHSIIKYESQSTMHFRTSNKQRAS